MLSVVIETENEADGHTIRLEHLIRALKRQTVPIDQCEVIFMVRESEAEIATPIRDLFPSARIELLNDPVGYCQMKMYGARMSRYPIVACIDSDCVPEPDWLEQALRHVRQASEDVIILQGRTKCLDAPGAGFFTMRLCGQPWRRDENSDWIILNNFAARKDVFERYPFADLPLKLGPEYLMIEKSRREGKKIRIVPQMRVTHNYPVSLKAWFIKGQCEAFDYAEMIAQVASLVVPPDVIKWKTKIHRLCLGQLKRVLKDLGLSIRLRRQLGFTRDSVVSSTTAAAAYWMGGVIGFTNWRRGGSRPDSPF